MDFSDASRALLDAVGIGIKMKVDIFGIMNRAKQAGGGSDKVALQPDGENTMMNKNPLGRVHIIGGRGGNGRE
jgi:hypothetical protein